MGFYKNTMYGFWREPDEGVGGYGTHVCQFPDTGMRKSWCKECEKVGEFNAETGKYEETK